MKKDQTFIQSLKGWLSGDAGLKQERELQQLAQDDPFMADALEGYQAVPEDDHVQKLQQIRNRLAGKEEKKRGFPIWLRVAAGGAILIVALFALRWVNNVSNTQIGQATPAAQEVEEESAEAATADVVEMEEAELKQVDAEDNAAASENVGSAVAEQPKTKTRKKRKALNQPKPSIANTAKQKDNADDRLAAELEEASDKLEGAAAGIVREEQKPGAVQPKEPVAKSEPSTAPSPKKEAVRSEERVAIAEELALEEDVADSFVSSPNMKSSQEKNQFRNISGLVTDSIGEPLVGVSVIVPGTDIATLTDLDGRYILPINTIAPELQFESVGFQSERISLSSVNIYNVRLSADFSSLQAVSTSEYGKRRAKKQDKGAIQGMVTIKASGLENVNTIGASPAGGLKKLNRTLRKNAQKIEVHYSQVGQSVSLTFRVGPGNKVEGVRVLQPKGLMLEKEAIRLIFLTEWELEADYLQTGATVTCRLKF